MQKAKIAGTSATRTQEKGTRTAPSVRINHLSLLNDFFSCKEIIVGDEEKARKKQALILVHGFASHQESNLPILKECECIGDRIIYTYDMRGCGESLGYGVNTQKNAIDFLRVIGELNRIRPNLKNVGLKPIGFSYGCHVVFEALHRYHKRKEILSKMNGNRPIFESYLDVPLSPPISICPPWDLKTGAGPMLRPLKWYLWIEKIPGINRSPFLSSLIFETFDMYAYKTAMQIARTVGRTKPLPKTLIDKFIKSRKEKLKKRKQIDNAEIVDWFEAMPLRKGEGRRIAKTIFNGTNIRDKVERVKSHGGDSGLFIVGRKDKIVGMWGENGKINTEVEKRFKELGKVKFIEMPHHPDEKTQQMLFRTVSEEIFEEELMTLPAPLRIGIRLTGALRYGFKKIIEIVKDKNKKED